MQHDELSWRSGHPSLYNEARRGIVNPPTGIEPEGRKVVDSSINLLPTMDLEPEAKSLVPSEDQILTAPQKRKSYWDNLDFLADKPERPTSIQTDIRPDQGLSLIHI